MSEDGNKSLTMAFLVLVPLIGSMAFFVLSVHHGKCSAWQASMYALLFSIAMMITAMVGRSGE
jgi:uncharacterized membrane protein YhaH (DUF805 family)